MAEFKVREVEGMRQVRVEIRDETVRARRGALSNLRGEITLTPNVPRPGDVFRALFTREARVRPYYTGTGSILLQPSLGGYHIFHVASERWILEPGAYWASEGGVDLGLWRESVWSSLWSGDGALVWKTTVRGEGLVAINAPGPVEVVDVEDGELRVQGRLVLGRTEGLRFVSKRPTTFLRSFISGQSRLRVYQGTGKALVCWTPYWNQHMYTRMTGENIERSLFE